MNKINIKEKFDLFTDYWNPKIIAEFNNNYIKVVKLKGDFIWHHHEEEDEIFYILEGELIIEFRKKSITLSKGEMLVVPAGVEHKPFAKKEVHVMLIEPKSTLNTGNITKNEKTKANLSKI